MEPTERKEELRKKFEDFLKPAPAQFHSLHRSDVFDFFYSEIEAREKASTKLREDALLVCQRLRFNDNELLQAKIKSRDRLVEAADEVIENWNEHAKNNYSEDEEILFKLHSALEKYTQLKQQSKT